MAGYRKAILSFFAQKELKNVNLTCRSSVCDTVGSFQAKMFTNWATPSLIAGLDCGLDWWTGLLDWITGSNQTASKSNDACVAHGTASKAEV